MIEHEKTCSINHQGSAGSMEATGLVESFQASVPDRKLRYINFLGDGDSKAFIDVKNSVPYEGKEINKLECVGHIQKRVGARLRKLKSTNKSKLADGKPLGGVGRLTEKMINKLQNYFGIAVRQCSGKSVYEMKKAIGAVLFHCSEAKSLENRHMMCPQTSESWFKYQADKINHTNTYKHKPGLPIVVKDAIKNIFMDLSDIDLLKKCLHGKTQNNNEGLNAIIWKRCPKDVYVGLTVIEIGTASAVINFNDGMVGITKVLTKLGMIPGSKCMSYCYQKDQKRIYQMNRKETDTVKHRRKQLRAKRKGFVDRDEEKEGKTYGAGEF